MFSGCLQDFSKMFSGCSDGSYWPCGIWWSFQMKVWTLKIQRNPMIPNYSMIPAAAFRWSQGIPWSPAIRWSIRSMDFDKPKVHGDTSITDGLVLTLLKRVCVCVCEEGGGGSNPCLKNAELKAQRLFGQCWNNCRIGKLGHPYSNIAQMTCTTNHSNFFYQGIAGGTFLYVTFFEVCTD